MRTHEGQLRKGLNVFHLWGLAVGLVISGEYFGWSYGWASAGTLGFLITTVVVAVMYTAFIQLAHARARDAVKAVLDVKRIGTAIGGPSLVVHSAAPDRRRYLQNPGLGRRISGDEPPLPRGDYDLAVVIADGLSATAVNAHAAAVTLALSAHLPGWSVAPVVLVRQGRVAIGHPIGLALGARAVVVLIGERPGLSAADSLSAYLTWDPRPGRPDSERNCVSNIRSPDGLAPDRAARRIAWLLIEAARLGFTGVELKDRSPGAGVERLDSP